MLKLLKDIKRHTYKEIEKSSKISLFAEVKSHIDFNIFSLSYEIKFHFNDLFKRYFV